MANYVTQASDLNKRTTLLLCIFLGWAPFFCGSYYWYVGRRAGWLRMLTMNYCLIGWVKDIIRIGFGNFRDGAGAPVRVWKHEQPAG